MKEQPTLTPVIFKAARKSLGLNQTELAERLGMTQVSISLYERGKQVIPPTVALAMCALLGGLDVEWAIRTISSSISPAK